MEEFEMSYVACELGIVTHLHKKKIFIHDCLSLSVI